jgi:hypothetical protein
MRPEFGDDTANRPDMLYGHIPEPAGHAIPETDLSGKTPVNFNGVGQGAPQAVQDPFGNSPDAHGHRTRIPDTHRIPLPDNGPEKIGVGFGHFQAVRPNIEHPESFPRIRDP